MKIFDQSWFRRMNAASGLLFLLMLSGCRTSSPFAPVDLESPGWVQRHYQVAWRSDADANELICDVIEAHHPSGRVFLQVSKTPITLVTVQVENGRWWVKYGPRPRSARGTVPPDAEHLWVLIALRHQEARHLQVEPLRGSATRWGNSKTGERIEGVPVLPSTGSDASVMPKGAASS